MIRAPFNSRDPPSLPIQERSQKAVSREPQSIRGRISNVIQLPQGSNRPNQISIVGLRPVIQLVVGFYILVDRLVNWYLLK